MLQLSDHITKVPFIGPVQAKKLERLGIYRIVDLLLHIPKRYVDSTNTQPISEARHTESATIKATVSAISNSYTRSRKTITRAKVDDGSGSINLIWFNQRFIIKSIHPTHEYLFQIKRSKHGGDHYVTNYEEIKQNGEQLHLGRISPIYKQTDGISTKWLRARLYDTITKVDFSEVSEHIENADVPLDRSIMSIHFPEDMEQLKGSIIPLQFDEMVGLAYDIKERKALIERYPGVPISTSNTRLQEIRQLLPFTLTEAQEETISEILEDLRKNTPMHRLINGDVGSGKTVLAMIAASATIEAGYKVILLAPTTILAKQHYENFKNNSSIVTEKLALVTSEETIYEDDAEMLIGTHALLHREDLPEDTALVIIDEQHRFGVEQRKKIREMVGGNFMPHYLSLSATPIPRTLARIIFGDMEVSTLSSGPSTRKTISSHLVPVNKRSDCYRWVYEQIKSTGTQAFIVLPLIETSEIETERDLSVLKIYKELSEGELKGLNINYLHGKLSDKVKMKRMSEFQSGKIDVLISTTVIEVGIDIPNANIMVIEGAERFGLAQLHQLRGRVGRGASQAYCYVIPSSEDPEAHTVERLKYFVSHKSGFDIAEYDLKDRGPGQITGAEQSGLPNLLIADLADLEMLRKAKTVAEKLPSRPFTIFEMKKSLS